jgi:hypothetical protein
MKEQFFSAVAASLVLVLYGCATAPRAEVESVLVRVEAAPNVPVSGAEVRIPGRPGARTDTQGLARVDLEGRQGDAFSVDVVCPDGFLSPKPIDVSLVALAEQAKVPEYRARCVSLTRSVVIAVRAEKGPNLPVMVLGREVARTDASGAATVHLDVRPHEPTTVSISTREARALLPQNPSMSFVATDNDDFLLFDVDFTTPAKDKPKPVANRARKAAPSGPTPL